MKTRWLVQASTCHAGVLFPSAVEADVSWHLFPSKCTWVVPAPEMFNQRILLLCSFMAYGAIYSRTNTVAIICLCDCLFALANFVTVAGCNLYHWHKIFAIAMQTWTVSAFIRVLRWLLYGHWISTSQVSCLRWRVAKAFVFTLCTPVVIGPASWREGQKLVKMVLGPAPRQPQEGRPQTSEGPGKTGAPAGEPALWPIFTPLLSAPWWLTYPDVPVIPPPHSCFTPLRNVSLDNQPPLLWHFRNHKRS